MWRGEDWEKDGGRGGGGTKMEIMAGLKVRRGEDEDIVCINITHWLHVLHNSLYLGTGANCTMAISVVNYFH